MATVLTINAPFADHLEAVTAQMREMGAPVIRCIRDEQQGIVLALEGSHRIAAAHALGLAPVLTMLGEDDELLCSDIGYDDNGWFEGEPARAADIRDRIAGRCGIYEGCPAYAFDNL